MFENWANLDYPSLAYDGTSMIVNGALDLPKMLKEWKQITCEGTCSCPDEDGNIPERDDECESDINRYAQGKLVGHWFVRFMGTLVSPPQ